MSTGAEWSYTEQMLHTLDEFQTPDGFNVKHSETTDEGCLGRWRISMKGPSPTPRWRFNIWLVMQPTGWVLCWVPSRNPSYELGRFEEPDAALTKAKELLHVREAAARLAGGA